MSTLLKKCVVFIGGNYYHGGEGLEKGAWRCYRSPEEYDKEAAINGWNDNKKSFKSSWVSCPVRVTCLVSQKKHKLWSEGKIRLEAKDLFFPADQLAILRQI